MVKISVETSNFARKIQSCYISTDEVKMYCYRSRDRYFMVRQLRNYSTTTETTMTKFSLLRKAIPLGTNPKKLAF